MANCKYKKWQIVNIVLLARGSRYILQFHEWQNHATFVTVRLKFPPDLYEKGIKKIVNHVYLWF
jgi:hypothetical protein